tara:strand:- start:7962 stop:8819 length:858 start_codon:yes stop_codon:yes gene_type:complete
MRRPLREIERLAEDHDAPVVYAGDVFDRWNAPAETINFAIKNLPAGFAIPGQHDLPNHNYHDIQRSAYWTLVEAGVLQTLTPGRPTRLSEHPGSRVLAYGWPWGFDVVPPCPPGHPGERYNPDPDMIHLAVIHAFAYTRGTGYVGADKDAHLSGWAGRLNGYTAAVFGDNHQGFQARAGGCNVVNNGGMMRRNINEAERKPGCSLLWDDGKISLYWFDTSADRLVQRTGNEVQAEAVFNTAEFMEDLRVIGGGDGLDFEDALTRWMDGKQTTKAVRDLVWRAVSD